MANYNGTNGDDSFVGTAGNDTFNAGEGHNRITAGEGHNNVNAGNGNDTVTAGSGNDTINAGGGNNVVDAGGGNNNVNSGSGNDTITTGSGNDVINAGDGTNLIRAGDGQNVVNTGSGADTITTGSGSDVINAGEGRNIVDAGAGNNVINTGSGADDILSGDGDDQINAGEGINIINAGNGHNRITSGAAADTITTGSGNDQIYAGEGANVIKAGNGNNAVYTGSSADVIETGSGNDTVYSGEGADRLSLGGGNDLVYMGGGNDVIRHVVSENIGANDDYWAEGGTDTLQLVLTAEQARNAAILADIQRFKAHLAGDGNWMFEFKAFKLTARQFERLELVAPVDAANDSATVGEDSQVTVAVLANDIDLLASNNGALRVVSFDASSVPGTVTLADNKFTYVPGAALQHLAVGQTATVSFTYTVADDQGFTDTATVTITVVGANDAPVALVDVASGREDGPALSGSVAANDGDVDTGAVLSYALLGPVEGLALASNGSWTFDTSAAGYQSLAQGEVKTIVAAYKVTDQHGASATSTLTITLTGTNDAPVVSSVVSGSATEDSSSVTLNALAHASDVDNGTVLSVVGVPAMLPAGVSYDAATARFSLDPADASYQYLAAGETLTVTVGYGVSDGIAVTPGTVSWTVTGTNDAPTITSAEQSGTVVEIADGAAGESAATLSATGTVTFADVDLLDTHGASFVAGGADYLGTFSLGGLDQGGDSVAWTFAVADGALDYLQPGEMVTQTYTVTVTDSQGATASQRVTVTITGTNDGPVAVADIGAGTENQTLTIDVLANDTDLDHGASFTLVSADAPQGKGVASIAGNQLVFTPGSDFDHLALGAVETVVVSYLMSDEHGAQSASTVTLTITGTNDGPVAVADTGAGDENQVLTMDVLANDTDVDDGAVFTLVSAEAPQGKGVASVVGNQLVFTPGADFDHLALGATETVVVSYLMADEHGAQSVSTLTLTITGTNDGPVAVADAGAGHENETLTIDVLANDTDVDDGAVFTLVSAEAPAGKGVASIAGNQLVFTPGTDFDHLAAGAVETVVVGYVMTDEHGAQSVSNVTVTITGTNDGPVAVADAAAGDENQVLTIDVLANDTDVDDGAAFTLVSAEAPQGKGAASIAGNQLVFTPGNDFDHLAAGAVETVTLTYVMTDEHGAEAASTVTLTITGTNDAPVVSGPQTAAVTEDGAVSVVAALANASDVDDGTILSVVDLPTLPAGVSFDAATNRFAFDPANAAYQSLALGQTMVVSVAYGVSDGLATAPTTISWTVTGTNDGPVAVADAVVRAENQQLAIDVLANDTDVDNGAVLTVLGAESPEGKGLAAVVGNKVLFAPGTDFDHLAPGQTEVVTLSYTIRDQHGAMSSSTVTVTVTGTNDAPIAGFDEAASTENQVITIDVLANDTDVDAGAVLTITGALAPYGQGIAAVVGNQVRFAPGTDFDHLAAGATETVTIFYAMRDQHGGQSAATITLTVTGTNDGPVVTSNGAAASGAVIEDGVSLAGGTLTSSDLDDGAIATWSGSANGIYGAFVIGASGSWTYALDNGRAATQALAVGQVATETFTATVTDDQGATATQVVTVTVTGTNDAPVVTSSAAAASGTVSEAGNTDPGGLVLGTAVAAGQLTSADVDAGASATWSGSADGTYGAFVMSSSGAWTYTLDNSRAATQALREGQAITENFTTTVTDEHGATATRVVTVTVNGTNDSPVITSSASAATGSVVEAGQNDDGSIFSGTPSASGTLTSSDVDTGATATWSGNANGVYGTFAVNTAGTWTYTLDNARALTQGLNEGQSVTETFTARVTDDRGAIATRPVTVTITGTNDAPVVTPGVVTGTVTAVANAAAAQPVIFTVEQWTGYESNNLANLKSYAASRPANYTIQTDVIDFTDDPGGFAGQIPGSKMWPAAAAQNATGTGGVNDTFFARVTTTFTVTEADSYTFRTFNDDGVFLHVDGQLILADTGYHAETAFDRAVTLQPGVHTLELYFYEGGGEASLELLVRKGSGAFGLLGNGGAGLGAPPAPTGYVTFNDLDTAGLPVASSSFVSLNGVESDGSAMVLTPAQTQAFADAFRISTPSGNGRSGTVNWSYPVTNEALAFLGTGDRVTAVFAITLTDQQGASTTQNVTVTINGVNDAPVVSAPVMAMATEDDASVTAVALANASDVDAGTTLSGVNVPTLPAGVSYDAATKSFTLDPSHSAYQSLALGQTTNVTVAYGVSDGLATTPASISWTVTGTNDVPVAVADINAVSEGAIITGSVAGNDSDIDAGAVLGFTLNAPVAGLTFNADGSYSFDAANPAYKYLNRGQTATVLANYTVTDQHGAGAVSTLTITVTGTNATPVAVADLANVNEGAAVLNGSVAANDSDADGDALTYTLNAPVDGLTFNANGSYSFNPSHPSYNSLAAGTVLPVVASYTVTDSFGESATSTLTIRVAGTNDLPVAVADTATAVEDGAVVTGNVRANDSDPDAGATLSYSLVSPVAGLTLNADGSYSFDPFNASYQSIGAGATRVVNAQVRVTDDKGGISTSTLAITVTGTNDAPVANDVTLLANRLGNGGFDQTPNFSGWTTSTALSGTTSGSGTVTIDRTGNVIPGDTAVAVLNFSGGVPNPYGTGQGPTITSAPFQATAGEKVRFVYKLSSGGDQAIGTGYIRDAATGQIVQTIFNYQVPFVGTTGVQTVELTLATTGTYTIDFRVGSYDATGGLAIGARLDIGFAGILANGISEDQPFTFATGRGLLLANSTDVDQGDVLSIQPFTTVSARGASITLDASGALVIDPRGAADSLAAGQQVTDSFTYQVSDGKGGVDTATASYTLVGANDAPVVSGAVTAAVNEDGGVLTLSAIANATDVDAGTVLSVTGLPGTLPAGVTYDATAKSFSLDASHAAFQALAAGQAAQVSVAYQVTDGVVSVPASVVWTVTGTNDVPAVTGAVTAAVLEDGATSTLNALGAASDADAGTVLSITDVPATLPAGVSYDAASKSFTLDSGHAAYQSLAAGVQIEVSVSYQISDGTASTLASARWTVTGTNDAPVVSGTVSGAVTENGSASTLSAIANATDVDNAVLNVTLSGSLPAGVSYNAVTKSFTIDPNHSAFQSLAAGQTTNVSVAYQVTDGIISTPASVSWTVTGTNDAPQIAAFIPDYNSTEDAAWTYTIPAATFADVDAGTTLIYSASGAGGAPLPAWLSFDAATRTFSGTPPQDYNGSIALQVTASDGTASVTDSFQLNIAAVDDIPVLTLSGATPTFVENGAAVTVDPGLSLVDVDGPNLSGAVIGITTNFNAAQDSLVFTAAHGITGSYNAGNGQLVLSGSATAAQYQDVLRSVRFTNASEAPTTGDRTIAFTVTTNGASSQYFAANGHFYQFVAGQYTFAQAQAAAAASTLFGLQGYLATITSAAENAFVTTKLTNSGWIGASDAAVEGQWRWITGPEAGTLFYQGRAGAGGTAVNGAYNAWAGGEPNQAGEEDYGHFYSNGSWNDFPGTSIVNGYIVEFGGMPGDPSLPLSGTATVRVQSVNDAPVVAATAAANVSEDGAAVTQNALAGATDVDSATLSVTNVGALPAGVTFNAATNSFTLNPSAYQSLAAGATQAVTVNYSVTDGVNATPASLSWTVQGSNDAPVVSVAIPDQATLSQGAFSYTVPAGAFTDVDAGAVLGYTASLADGSALPGWLNFDAATRTFSGTPPQTSEGFIDVRVTASDGTLSVVDSFRLTVQPNVYTGTSGNDSYAGSVRSERIVGAGGNDTLSGSSGNDVIYGGADGELGPSPATPSSLTAVAQSYYTASKNLINTLGGNVGFGEGILAKNDDGFTGPLNITSVFGAAGLNFFGTSYTSLSVNNNGNLTFGQGYGSYTPSPIAPTGLPPIIAAFWTDIDTSSASGVTSPGGTSRGTNLVYYDFDTVNKVLTATWDDVGQYPSGTTPNAFQIQLIDRGSGNFDIIYRYEMIQWNYTGARAGFSSGNGTAFEFEGSGTAAVLNYDSITGNTGIAGVQIFEVRNGQVSTSDNDVLNGGAGQDILVGGTGNDIFVFRAGEANGDQVLDFNGFGAATGDSLRFEGYGAGATFTKIDATHWQVTYNGGASHDVITFANAPSIDPTDWLFFP